jgi:hypothetical protein
MDGVGHIVEMNGKILLSVTLISHPLQQTHVTINKICRHFFVFFGAFARLSLPGANCFLTTDSIAPDGRSKSMRKIFTRSPHSLLPSSSHNLTSADSMHRYPSNQTRQRRRASSPRLGEVPCHGPPHPLCVDQHRPTGVAKCDVQVGGAPRQQVCVNHGGIFLQRKIDKDSPLFSSLHLGENTWDIFASSLPR